MRRMRRGPRHARDAAPRAALAGVHGPALALALAASAAMGCTDETGLMPGAPEVALGSAAPEQAMHFLEIDDGTDVTLVPGAQGGFHVWLGMRLRGVAGPVQVEREARRVSDDALVFRGLPQTIEVPEEALDGWWASPNVAPAFMCPSPIGIRVFDEALVFTVFVRDADAALIAMDQIVMVPHCPEGSQQEFCLEICSG